MTTCYPYNPRSVYPIKNDITKSMRSALNVCKGSPRTNATRNARRYAVQLNVTAVVVCYLQIKQVCTTDLSILGVGRRKFVHSVFFFFVDFHKFVVYELRDSFTRHIKISARALICLISLSTSNTH